MGDILLHADLVDQMVSPDTGHMGPLLNVNQRNAHTLHQRQDQGPIAHIPAKHGTSTNGRNRPEAVIQASCRKRRLSDQIAAIL